VPGVYFFASSAQLTGTLTLNAQGDTSAVWVFQIGSTLTTASNSSVVVENGGQYCNVFWQVGSSATLGTGTTFIGNILAKASITLTTGAILSGRALAETAAVTLDTNTVTVSACALPAVAPTIGKAFSPATIDAGGVSALAITLSNGGTTADTGSAFTDTLPSGVTVSSFVSNGCGGTVNTTSSTVTLTGGTIPAGSFCTVTVNVTAPTADSYINSLAEGALVTNNGSNAAPAVATLTVIAPTLVAPTIGKAFSPATIYAGEDSLLTITLTNTGTTPATLTKALTDTLPPGVVVDGIVSSTCIPPQTGFNMQQLTRQPRFKTVAFRIPVKMWAWLTAGTSTVNIAAGASIPAGGSCTVTVNVTAPVAGTYINTLLANALETNKGNNLLPAVATLTVIPNIQLTKSFSPTSIYVDGVSTLTITLTNPQPTVAKLTAWLTDYLPGLVIASPPNASNGCGGTLTANKGGYDVILRGASIPANGSCTVKVDVTTNNVGSNINSLPIGALQTSNGSNNAAAVATLTVIPTIPPTLSKSFSPASINVDGVSTLTITLGNPNSRVAKLTASFTDYFPDGVVIASTPKASTTCGGTLTANKGSWKVILTGASIPASSSCTVMVNVTANSGGKYINSLPIGTLYTSNGSNTAAAVATLTVK